MNFSSAVTSKGREYAQYGHVRQDPEHPDVYRVRGSGTKPYRVQTDADPQTRKVSWISCTCPYAQNNLGMFAECSHAVAVLVTIRGDLDG